LSPFAVEIRYDAVFDPSSEETNEALNFAVEFNAFVNNVVAAYPPTR
jgi:hypothetical protein